MHTDPARVKRGVSLVRKIFGFIAVSMLLTALGFFIWRTNQLSSYDQAQGTVVSLQRARPTRANRSASGSYPVVKFEVGGTSHQFVGGLATSPPAFRVGEAVQVYYDPANPDDAIVGSFWQLWFLPILFGSMGLFFMLPITVMSRMAKKRRLAQNG